MLALKVRRCLLARIRRLFQRGRTTEVPQISRGSTALRIPSVRVSTKVPLRPKSWENWRAHGDGKVARSAHEFDLYSDSVVFGLDQDFGPYQLINLGAGDHRETALARPVIALRISYAANPNPEDSDADHGRGHPDEIAALASLILGIRLRSGDKTRYFNFSSDEPLGRPRAQAEVNTPYLPQGHWTALIPHARRDRENAARLEDLSMLSCYPKLDAPSATALLRAARLYQEGLWVVEREPWLAWVLFVNAAETAASEHKLAGSQTPAELLRELSPDLAKAAEKYGEQCVADIAKVQMRMLGATRSFLAFLTSFLPDAPIVRPTSDQLEWSAEGLRPSLKQVYQFRSRYVHAGDPFPWQLRMAPEFGGGVPVEHPSEVLAPDDEKPPMHLHVFERIVRGALVKWWAHIATR